MSSFCYADHHHLGGRSLNVDMSSVPSLSGFAGGGHGHDLSKLGGNNARESAEAAATDEVTRKKGDRAATALNNHSEAERRRRERINAHLATLRGMLPCTDKMDKAALLAEVITHVKKLKMSAARVSSRCPSSVPADADEVTVELVQNTSSSSSHGNGSSSGFLVKATLSCDDGADTFADVKSALRPLRLRVVGSEVATTGGRVRLTVLASPACGEDAGAVAESVRQALQSVIDKATSALEFAPRASLLNKRRRVSTFDSSSSCS